MDKIGVRLFMDLLNERIRDYAEADNDEVVYTLIELRDEFSRLVGE